MFPNQTHDSADRYSKGKLHESHCNCENRPLHSHSYKVNTLEDFVFET